MLNIIKANLNYKSAAALINTGTNIHYTVENYQYNFQYICNDLVERDKFLNDVHTAAVEYYKDTMRYKVLGFFTAILLS